MTNTFSESAVYFIATYKISITCRISDNGYLHLTAHTGESIHTVWFVTSSSNNYEGKINGTWDVALAAVKR